MFVVCLSRHFAGPVHLGVDKLCVLVRWHGNKLQRLAVHMQDLSQLDAEDPGAAAMLHACATQLEQCKRDLADLEQLVSQLEAHEDGTAVTT